MGLDKEKLLEVKDLEVSFFTKAGEVKAVRKINYELHRGEVLGIVGESGSGKSVSSHCMLKLIPNSGKIIGGQILFDGKDITKMSNKDILNVRGNDIGMIFQDPMTSLDSVFTIGYQINETLKKHTKLNDKERKARICELLELVGITQPEKRMNQYPHEFSGGMRQRAMIAMALACNPKLLIADEPTTALDVTIQAQIIDLIKGLKEKLGMAIIFITHDLGVVADISDRIAVMYAGEIVEIGKKEEIFYHKQHPYTEGLFKSIPRIDQTKYEKLRPIEGNPPNMIQVPEGCAFAARCTQCMKICVKQKPPLTKLADDHQAACWLTVKEGGSYI